MEASSSSPTPGSRDSDRFDDFVAGITDYAIYALSPEGRVRSWNAGAQRFSGYSADEIIGKHFSLIYTDEERAVDAPARALQAALTDGRFEAEGWRVRKDGRRFWATVVINPIRDSNGVLQGFTGIGRDITERKLAQEALHASEERLRLLVQSVTDYAIYMLSSQGEVINWNAGAARIKGYSSSEIVGSHFSRFYTEEDRARGLPGHGLNTAAREGRYETEGWRVRKDGTQFWAHVVIDPVRDDSGKLIGFAKVTRDITEKRRAAEALQHAQEALLQSQKLEAIGKLTGGVAHDFNNLLGVIVTGLELLAREVRAPTAMKVLDSMERAAARGSMLTRQLLSFARQQPLRQETHNVGRVIGSFEAVLRRACDESVAFVVNLAPRLKPVLIDAIQFEAGLLNLVANARDAMPDGGTLTISAENVVLRQHEIGKLPAGWFVKVTVADTGSGMSAETASRAVEPFFTTKKIGEGTGMGLSQVYGLVQQSGGELMLESEVGTGTVVSLYLPARPEIEGESNEVALNTASRAEKALVVDDQPDVLNVAVELFRTLGYEVLSANDGTEALEIIRRTPDVDVLFADVLMPGINGVALARHARTLIPSVKVMLASGFPIPALTAENVDTTDFDLIAKPYRLAEIARLLRTWSAP